MKLLNKKNIKIINNRQGFTLIEFTIYISIISVLLTVVTLVVWNVFSARIKSQANQEVIYNADFILRSVQRQMRNAKDIVSFNSSTLVLAAPDGRQITIGFDLPNKTIFFQEGSGEPLKLSSNRVDVSGSFYNYSFMNRSRNIGIHLEVANKTQDSSREYSASVKLDSAYELGAR